MAYTARQSNRKASASISAARAHPLPGSAEIKQVELVISFCPSFAAGHYLCDLFAAPFMGWKALIHFQ